MSASSARLHLVNRANAAEEKKKASESRNSRLVAERTRYVRASGLKSSNSVFHTADSDCISRNVIIRGPRAHVTS